MISTPDNKAIKKTLRQQIRRLKSTFSLDERDEMSSVVIHHLMDHPKWQSARTVLLYHSLPDEVNTHQLITSALHQGKRVILPVVVGDDLELRECISIDDLHEGAFHIFEPDGEPFTDFDAIDLAIIPGVAFTTDGRRLGRGRGYYDRLLKRNKTVYKIGICWPFQLLPDIPTEQHDIRLDEVVS